MPDFDEIDILADRARHWQNWARISHCHCVDFTDDAAMIRDLQQYRKLDAQQARAYLFRLLKAKKG